MEPVSEYVGVQVNGVDLTEPLDEQTYLELDRALSQYGMLLFRDQTIKPEHHIAMSRWWGELEVHVLDQYQLPGHPEIFVISNIKENGKNIGAFGGGHIFHSDMSYLPRPSLGSLFYCVECSPQGGGTSFASMFTAFEELPSKQQQWLQQQTAIHDYVWHYETYLTHRAPLTDEQKANLQPTPHTAVRTHPVSGKQAVYISSGLTREFEGMGFEESRLIIEEIASSRRRRSLFTRISGEKVIWCSGTIVRPCTELSRLIMKNIAERCIARQLRVICRSTIKIRHNRKVIV
jgi:taurine dioxygenase